jgi:creatinine amidohydrolase/Fe(II)-dependent formamide hydrolase-like protein
VRTDAIVDDPAPGGFVPDIRPSGVFGSPSLATADKGRLIVDQWLTNIQKDLDTLRSQSSASSEA